MYEESVIKNKKGQAPTLFLLATFAIVFLIAIITTAIAGKILNEFSTNGIFDVNGTVYQNLTRQGEQGLQQFANFYPIVGIVIIGAVIIGLLVQFRG